MSMFGSVYQSARVLVTGHTGFKGSWLCSWLHSLGAMVCGIGLPMPSLSHFPLLGIPMESREADIRDSSAVRRIFSEFQPEIVFHLAAQPIVRLSYHEPVATFETNVMGTVRVLEACRETPSVRAIVVISSDKCYENREITRGYCEEDPMGGYDPYSASKGCTELVVSSYRRSFFNPCDYGEKHRTLLASARAGNVIGGGDWAPDRLIPDLIRAAACGEEAILRNPSSVRPWQHVLEPLSGYLMVGEKLLSGDVLAASPWNFGPGRSTVLTVSEAAEALSASWDAIRFRCEAPLDAPHEARLLQLDCRKAEQCLGWHGVLTAPEAFEFTAGWYRDFYLSRRVDTMAQLQRYTALASERGLPWCK